MSRSAFPLLQCNWPGSAVFGGGFSTLNSQSSLINRVDLIPDLCALAPRLDTLESTREVGKIRSGVGAILVEWLRKRPQAHRTNV